ncbi:DUF3958 family protein [Listeria grayi]|uniref:DUF3958 family protein n=1 Tax=Listeria grayi TaxID=1641 RepID=UPI001626ABF2|nr:DUF3958 family protein [Listeria grayi]MBC1922901.1 DUF3958 family protein [Listeria grayi]
MGQLEAINHQLGQLEEEQHRVATAHRRNENTRTALEEHHFQRSRLFQELKETFQTGEISVSLDELDFEARRYHQQLEGELLESEQELKKKKRTLEAQEEELYRKRRKLTEETQ